MRRSTKPFHFFTVLPGVSGWTPLDPGAKKRISGSVTARATHHRTGSPPVHETRWKRERTAPAPPARLRASKTKKGAALWFIFGVSERETETGLDPGAGGAGCRLAPLVVGIVVAHNQTTCMPQLQPVHDMGNHHASRPVI
jgi:hypothetical protein